MNLLEIILIVFVLPYSVFALMAIFTKPYTVNDMPDRDMARPFPEKKQ